MFTSHFGVVVRLLPTHPNVLDALRDRLHDWDAFIDFQISREPPEKGTP